jgi:hypothetical protein
MAGIDFWNGLKQGFRAFSANINAVVNTVLLSIAYVIGIGVTALVAKVAGKKFLTMQRAKGTYWKPVQKREQPLDEAFRQF